MFKSQTLEHVVGRYIRPVGPEGPEAKVKVQEADIIVLVLPGSENGRQMPIQRSW